MTDLPEPLTPADCDCRDLDGFMLNVERLMASELVALSSPEVIGAAFLLWCRSWKQFPAASLPDDDRVLAAFTKLAPPRFRKLKAEIMRGFTKCADGRFYHHVMAAEANKASGKKAAFRKKRETDAERLRDWRRSRGETPNETPDETRFNTPAETAVKRDVKRVSSQRETGRTGTGTGTGTGKKKEDNPPPPEPEAARCASAVVWKDERMPIILAKVPNIDPTSAGIQNFAPLRKLEADNLDFDQDILPALIAVGASWNNPKRLIHSWGLPSFADMAYANRERRNRVNGKAVDWDAALQIWREHGYWNPHNGPAPDQPGYRGPEAAAA